MTDETHQPQLAGIMRRVILLQEAVVLDPYARSIVGRQKYGQLAKVSILHGLAFVVLAVLRMAIGLLHAQTSKNQAVNFGFMPCFASLYGLPLMHITMNV